MAGRSFATLPYSRSGSFRWTKGRLATPLGSPRRHSDGRNGPRSALPLSTPPAPGEGIPHASPHPSSSPPGRAKRGLPPQHSPKKNDPVRLRGLVDAQPNRIV